MESFTTSRAASFSPCSVPYGPADEWPSAALFIRIKLFVLEVAGQFFGRGQSQPQQLFVEAAGGAVKPAILLAAGADDLEDANTRLDLAGGRIRAAMAAMTNRA